MRIHDQAFGLNQLPSHDVRAGRRRRPRCFTLIELLVVIAIIALLVTLLVPALQEAKRLAKVAVCASNMHQLGVGVAMYVNDHLAFPPPALVSGATVWRDYYIYDASDALLDIASGNGWLLFCPLYPGLFPDDNTVEGGDSADYGPFSDHYYINPEDPPGGNPQTWARNFGYAALFLFIDNGTFDWSQTEFPEGPYDPFENGSRNVYFCDDNRPDPNTWDWRYPFSGHNGNWYVEPFYESNRLHGDGHVESASAPMKYVVSRWGLPVLPF